MDGGSLVEISRVIPVVSHQTRLTNHTQPCKIENSKTLTLSGEELKDIINNTSYAASRDDLKPVLQGVLFQIENEGIVSVATAYRAI